MATNHDIRQTLHNLSLWSSAGKAISVEDAEKESARNKKSLKMVGMKNIICLSLITLLKLNKRSKILGTLGCYS